MAGRRSGFLCLPLALVLLASGSARAAGPLPAASSEAFDSVLGNTASCHRACQLTYSLHTYPKVRAGPASQLPAAGRAPSRARPRSPSPFPGSRAAGLACSAAPASPARPGPGLAPLPPQALSLRGDRRGFPRAGALLAACPRASSLRQCWTCPSVILKMKEAHARSAQVQPATVLRRQGSSGLNLHPLKAGNAMASLKIDASF